MTFEKVRKYTVKFWDTDEDGERTGKKGQRTLPTLFEAREFAQYYLQRKVFISLTNMKGVRLPI